MCRALGPGNGRANWIGVYSIYIYTWARCPPPGCLSATTTTLFSTRMGLPPAAGIRRRPALHWVPIGSAQREERRQSSRQAERPPCRADRRPPPRSSRAPPACHSSSLSVSSSCYFLPGPDDDAYTYGGSDPHPTSSSSASPTGVVLSSCSSSSALAWRPAFALVWSVGCLDWLCRCVLHLLHMDSA